MVHKTTQKAAHDAVSGLKANDEIRQAIKDITLSALTKQQLDKENIKIVLESVFAGISEGLKDSGARMKPALQASLSGVDEALSKSTLAARLAAEEVLASTEKFAQVDLKQSVEDLRALEDLLFDSINQASKRSSSLVSSTLNDLAGHYKNTGTLVGKTAKEAIHALGLALEGSGKQGVSEMAQVSKDLAGHMAAVASGILAGMAEAIKPKEKS